MLYYKNYDLTNVTTPVNAENLHKLLIETKYDKEKTKFLIEGIKKGFSLQYQGNRQVTRLAPNLKFIVGNKLELWNQVMGEVKLGRYAGPYRRPPFKHFIQSPIGLVPKDGGLRTRLIFHLSYPKGGTTSVNSNTPKELCKVKYMDFDDAIRRCVEEGKFCYLAKSDIKSAFRHLGIRPEDWMLLVMKAESPLDGEIYYFVDKCLPFGHALSCALFQKFSDAISHIVEYKTKRENVNYLDDFLFVAITKYLCNNQIDTFNEVCWYISVPVALEKTYWACSWIVFLGLLIDGFSQRVSIPCEKVFKISAMLQGILDRDSNKIQLYELQVICGHLNFICRCVIPGRAFTRRLYLAMSGLKKQHHHTRLTVRLKNDLKMWLKFLQSPEVFSRPFLDFGPCINAQEICLFTDASKNAKLGAGGVCGNSWFMTRWDEQFILKNNPSIEFLELYAVAVAVVAWIHRFKNQRIILFCDNMAVVHMVNKNTSSCDRCLNLIRIIVLESMLQNVRVFATHVRSRANKYADLLSRMRLPTFLKLGRGRFESQATPIPEQLKPLEKVWNNKY